MARLKVKQRGSAQPPLRRVVRTRSGRFVEGIIASWALTPADRGNMALWVLSQC